LKKVGSNNQGLGGFQGRKTNKGRDKPFIQEKVRRKVEMMISLEGSRRGEKTGDKGGKGYKKIPALTLW